MITGEGRGGYVQTTIKLDRPLIVTASTESRGGGGWGRKPGILHQAVKRVWKVLAQPFQKRQRVGGDPTDDKFNAPFKATSGRE